MSFPCVEQAWIVEALVEPVEALVEPVDAWHSGGVSIRIPEGKALDNRATIGSNHPGSS